MAVILQASADTATSRDEELNAVYQKTQKYVNRFNSMKNDEKERQEIVDELDNLQECVSTYTLLVCKILQKNKQSFYWPLQQNH